MRLRTLDRRGQFLLVIFCGNLLTITLDFPGQAYKGIFETIADAAQSMQPAAAPAAVPLPSVQLAGQSDNPYVRRDIAEAAANPVIAPMGTLYNAAGFVDDATLKDGSIQKALGSTLREERQKLTMSLRLSRI